MNNDNKKEVIDLSNYFTSKKNGEVNKNLDKYSDKQRSKKIIKLSILILLVIILFVIIISLKNKVKVNDIPNIPPDNSVSDEIKQNFGY